MQYLGLMNGKWRDSDDDDDGDKLLTNKKVPWTKCVIVLIVLNQIDVGLTFYYWF